MNEIVERYEDMSPGGKLILMQQIEGDFILCIKPDPKSVEYEYVPFGVTVEFCTHGGGGQSPHTWKALKMLFEAIENDNIDNQQNRG